MKLEENLKAFQQTRRETLEIVEPLEVEDFVVQSAPYCSPPKWHLAHTSWFFENFLCKKLEGSNYQPFDSSFSYLFNSYYNGEGRFWPQSERGNLSRPTVKKILAYRKNIETRIFDHLESGSTDSEVASILKLGIEHEKQHQELLYTDIKHLLSQSPFGEKYRDDFSELKTISKNESRTLSFLEDFYEVGAESIEFSYDCETPKHKVFIPAFSLDSNLVSKKDWIDFIESKAYQTSSLWLSEAWNWIQNSRVDLPLYWKKEGSEYYEFTLSGFKKVNPEEPMVHLNYFEADAYARWKNARLPSEFELEIAMKKNSLRDGFENVWQWSKSAYLPYPKYKPLEGSFGEYNGKFMVNQMVLKGSSWATPKGHSRPSYRNFFQPSTQWQFTGMRLAYDE